MRFTRTDDAHHEARETHVDRGAYPFPLTDGPEESRYLTWLRNYSNYMAVHGMLDYVRAISVLLRGIIVNALVLLPFLIGFSWIVAWRHLYGGLYLERPFELTLWVLAAAGIAVALFALGAPHFRIARQQERRRTGSDSSVKMRNAFERLFGALLILLVGTAGFETLSVLLDDFHVLVQRGFGGVELASIAALALTVFAGADRLLKLLGGAAKALAMLAIGALGLMLPLLLTLYVANFLVFGPPDERWSEWAFYCYMLFVGIIALALSLGVSFRSLTRMETVSLSVLLVVVVGGGIALVRMHEAAWASNDEFKSRVQTSLGAHTEEPNPIRRAAQQEEMDEVIETLANEPGPQLLNLIWFFETERMWWDRPEQERVRESDAHRWVLEDLQACNGILPGCWDLGVTLQELTPSQREPLISDVREFVEFRRHSFGPAIEAMSPSGRSPISHGANTEFEERADLLRALVPHFGLYQLEQIQQLGSGETRELPVHLRQVQSDLESAREELARLGQHFLAAREELALRAHFSRAEYPELYRSALPAHLMGFRVKSLFLVVLTVLLFLICWITVDVNLTSIHGLYRDRLASAFLVGVDTKGDIDIERDLDLAEICRHEAGSTAPYHLLNVALNLQGSHALGVRDRKSDFFIFSKRFIGGERTAYCRSETTELVFPQMDLATAMAISAGAASPNMGRATSPALIAIMALLNIRMGYWLPNPRRLETWLAKQSGRGGKKGGYAFDAVFAEELEEVGRRWEQLPERARAGRRLSMDGDVARGPTPEHGLVGLGCSGGGIRSATLNLGITQALQARGVFHHVDHISTVSGGGYLGSSLSALMREKTPTTSEISGSVKIGKSEAGERVVSVTRTRRNGAEESRTYCYAPYAVLTVEGGQRIQRGHRLIRTGVQPTEGHGTLGEQFHWRVKPWSLLKEVAGRLNERSRWVNVSDGGHIENLAGIELLRRRCRYVILGDAENDPDHRFNGVATLIRSARIDLGIHVDIDLEALRLDDERQTLGHFAVGRIHYPNEPTPGTLLYLKSSISGDEDEVIRQYRRASPSFPHETTADQSFTEGQFEAYRSLGQHIAEQALKDSGAPRGGDGEMSFAEFEEWFRLLGERIRPRPAERDRASPGSYPVDSVV